MLLQSRLAEYGLSILDVGGAGDCFFRAVSHQLYGEPSYHMNIRGVGVQYMRANPDRFTWMRYTCNCCRVNLILLSVRYYFKLVLVFVTY